MQGKAEVKPEEKDCSTYNRYFLHSSCHHTPLGGSHPMHSEKAARLVLLEHKHSSCKIHCSISAQSY